MERTNHRAAFGKEEELAMERTNHRAAFGKEEELAIERTNQSVANVWLLTSCTPSTRTNTLVQAGGRFPWFKQSKNIE